MLNRTLFSDAAIVSGSRPDHCEGWKGFSSARKTGASCFFRSRCCNGQWRWRLTRPWLSALEGGVLPLGRVPSVPDGQTLLHSFSNCLPISGASIQLKVWPSSSLMFSVSCRSPNQLTSWQECSCLRSWQRSHVTSGLRTTQKNSPQTLYSDYNRRSYCLEFPLIRLVRTGVWEHCLNINLNEIRGWRSGPSGVPPPDGIPCIPLK